ncbi:HAD family phosphatase [Corynebacterium sp.]|uniref:HAD family hydrolase n=1 Tax=Corynebacterium sp. TaxID=1720 RepID=UPI0026E0823C|nr:HAD family phosphatase [Corynebacterium sp.]MDO5511135.1 HAD family phosphatase [Corynebacterium sp.]
MRTTPAAIFWDMDGTLVDTEPLWEQFTYELSELMGRRLTPQLRETTIGGSFRHTIEVCATHAGITVTDDDHPRYREFMNDRMGELMRASLAPNPGITELLDDLATRDLPMLVTTNTERSLADISIGAVGRQYFVDSVTGDEVPSPKPAPDMYLRAAEIVGADPADCLVFEDSVTGMTAAVTAGCRVIGLPWYPDTRVPEGVVTLESLHGRNDFRGADADTVMEWFHQLQR